MTKETTEKDPKKEDKKKKQKDAFDDFGDQVEKFASKTAESIKKVIDKTLSSRNKVLTIRVDEDSNTKLNMLVESGIFKSRSESAAFLIQEGIKNQENLFSKITAKLQKIEKLKEELSGIISEEINAKVEKKEKAAPKTSRGQTRSQA
ncbi:MAG: hypothetical protein PVI11_02765 [Candidatus Aminicenantes bacterium]|jgi:Arc/MetJ-type ribon-helix-helix transcriptional regulator